MQDDLAGARRVLWLSTSAFTLLFAIWLMLGVLGVSIRDELGLGAVELGWLTATAVFSGSLLRLPFGILADRHGGRAIMVGLLVFSGLSAAFLPYAQGFAEVLGVALLFGVAGNAFSVGIAWNAAWFPRAQQGVALGTFGAGNVGASITKLAGPALITLAPVGGYFGGLVPGGWRLIPLVYTVAALAMAVAVHVWSPRPERTPGQHRTVRDMLWPLRVVRVWRFGLYYVVVFGAYVAFSLWLPSYYHDVYGLPLRDAALLTALFVFPASLLRPVGGALSDRFGARPVTYAVFGGMALACVPLCLPHGSEPGQLGLWPFFSAVEALGVGMGIGKASVYKYVPDYFPRDVGAVGGIVGTVGALGGFVMPIAFGYLQRFTGHPESCFWVMAALLLSSFVWLQLVVASLKRARSRGDLGEIEGAGV